MSDNKQRMSPAELREMCIYAAATATVSYVLGCGYKDIRVTDDGERWPTAMSYVDLAGTDEHFGFGTDHTLGIVAAIFEAGGLASLKSRGLGSHAVDFDNLPVDTCAILDDEKVWAAVEALAAHIAVNEDFGGRETLGAPGVDDSEEGDGAEGSGIKVLKDAGLYHRYWLEEGDDLARARLERKIEASPNARANRSHSDKHESPFLLWRFLSFA